MLCYPWFFKDCEVVMSKKNYYAMKDSTIAAEIGQRLEKIRLELNISQQKIMEELGISDGTYRAAIHGRMKIDVLIGILRILGKLENIDNFLPETPFSPLALLKREGKKRKRASPEREIVQATIAENDEW